MSLINYLRKNFGAEQEQQRILGLIRKFYYPETEPLYEMSEREWAITKGQIHQYRRELVALIKGENK